MPRPLRGRWRISAGRGRRPAISFTETHQVIVRVGYAKGAEVARRLEDNHIILNYQAAPDEEGFTASGALRMGVQEMTRFGMQAEDFAELARLMADCILKNNRVKDPVAQLRGVFWKCSIASPETR